MPMFVDEEGRHWNTRVDVATLPRVKELAGVDLGTIESGQEIVRMSLDPCQLVAVLYALCLPQIEERQLTERQFAALFSGDILEEATKALVDGIIAFFPKGQREALEKVRAATERGIQKVHRLAADSIDPDRLEAEIETNYRRALDASSLKS